MKRTLALTSLVVLALAGCTAAPPATPTPTPTERAVEWGFENGLVTYPRDPSGVTMAAIVSGVLTLVDGCVKLDDYVVAFPDDLTEWDGTTLTFGGDTYALGDSIQGGGGYIPVELPDAIADVCGGGEIAFMQATY